MARGAVEIFSGKDGSASTEKFDHAYVSQYVSLEQAIAERQLTVATASSLSDGDEYIILTVIYYSFSGN